MLIHYSGAPSKGITFRDRLNYVLDQNNPTPGNENVRFSRFDISLSIFPGYITREQGERAFNRLDRYNKSVFLI